MSRPITNATREDGTRYYRGGCARGMPLRGACRLDCRHRLLVDDYRQARLMWEERRQSGHQVSTRAAAGALGTNVSMHQLEDDEYRAAYPPPTFKAWLIEWAGRWSDEAVA